MKNKKIIFILLFIFILILLTIFFIFYYKTEKTGNTMINQSEEKIIDTILNMTSYQAKLNITIETNKNKTKYVVNQKMKNGVSIQEVLQPENIAGLTTEYDGKKLKIKNSKLNLETTFENYPYIVENRLWLDSFVEEYKAKENTKKSSTENEIILEVEDKENLYNTYKKLYIDKKTGKPTKMEVEDINQKMLVYILYSEITISK